MSAIHNLLINAGFPSHTKHSPKVELVIRGVWRVKASLSSPTPRAHLPITPSILLKLKNTWSADYHPISADKCMLWAAVCLGFFEFLRCAEFTVPATSAYEASQHLSLDDVSADKSTPISTITIHIKCSKTEQFHRGVSIYFSRTGTAFVSCVGTIELPIGLPGPAWHTKWSVVSLLKWAAIDQSQVCCLGTADTYLVGVGCVQVHWSQFLNWDRYDSLVGWHIRCEDQNAGQVGEFSISAVPLHSQRRTSISFLHAGGHCHLTLTIGLVI